MQLRDAADKVAREFLETQYRDVRDGDVGIARNVILDCLFSSPASPNFIVEASQHPCLKRTLRRVLKRMEPQLIELVGRTLALRREAD
jgi:hypothetical protein